MTNDQTVKQASAKDVLLVQAFADLEWLVEDNRANPAAVELATRHRTAHSGEGRETCVNCDGVGITRDDNPCMACGGSGTRGVSAPTQRMEKTLGAKFVASGEGRSNGAGEGLAAELAKLRSAYDRALSQADGADHKPIIIGNYGDLALQALPRFIAALSAHQGEVERLRKALAAIAREVEVANDVIRLERDLSGSGRVKVATAIHRIRELVALAQAEAGGE